VANRVDLSDLDLSISSAPLEETEPEEDFVPRWFGPEPSTSIDLLPGGREYLRLRDKMEKGRAGYFEQAQMRLEDVPLVGTTVDLFRNARMAKIAEAVNNGEKVSDKDLLDLNLWILQQDRDAKATFGGKVGRGIANMLNFWGEIVGVTAAEALIPGLGESFGIYGAAKTGAATAAKSIGPMTSARASAKALQQASNNLIAAKLGSKTAAAFAGRQAVRGATALGTSFGIYGTAMTLGTPIGHVRSLGGYQERKIWNELQGNDEAATSMLFDAYLDSIIEYGSEYTGEALKAGVQQGIKWTGEKLAHYGGRQFASKAKMLASAARDKMIKGAPMQLTEFGQRALRKVRAADAVTRYMNKHGISYSDAAEFFQRAGIGGYWEELGEERVGGFFKGLLGVEMGDTESGLAHAIDMAIPEAEDFAVEALTFSILPLGQRAFNKVLESSAISGISFDKRKQNYQMIKDAVEFHKEPGAVMPSEFESINEAVLDSIEQEADEDRRKDKDPSTVRKIIHALDSAFDMSRRGSVKNVLRQMQAMNLVDTYNQVMEATKDKNNPEGNRGQARAEVKRQLARYQGRQAIGIETPENAREFQKLVDEGVVVRREYPIPGGKSQYQYHLTDKADLSKPAVQHLIKQGMVQVVPVAERGNTAFVEVTDVGEEGTSKFVVDRPWNELSESEKSQVFELSGYGSWYHGKENKAAGLWEYLRLVLEHNRTLPEEQRSKVFLTQNAIYTGTPAEMEKELGEAYKPRVGETPWVDNGDYKKNVYARHLGASNENNQVFVSPAAWGVSVIEDSIEAQWKDSNTAAGRNPYDIGEAGQEYLNWIRANAPKRHTLSSTINSDSPRDQFEFLMKQLIYREMGLGSDYSYRRAEHIGLPEAPKELMDRLREAANEQTRGLYQHLRDNSMPETLKPKPGAAQSGKKPPKSTQAGQTPPAAGKGKGQAAKAAQREPGDYIIGFGNEGRQTIVEIDEAGRIIQHDTFLDKFNGKPVDQALDWLQRTFGNVNIQPLPEEPSPQVTMTGKEMEEAALGKKPTKPRQKLDMSKTKAAADVAAAAAQQPATSQQPEPEPTPPPELTAEQKAKQQAEFNKAEEAAKRRDEILQQLRNRTYGLNPQSREDAEGQSHSLQEAGESTDDMVRDRVAGDPEEKMISPAEGFEPLTMLDRGVIGTFRRTLDRSNNPELVDDLLFHAAHNDQNFINAVTGSRDDWTTWKKEVLSGNQVLKQVIRGNKDAGLQGFTQEEVFRIFDFYRNLHKMPATAGRIYPEEQRVGRGGTEYIAPERASFRVLNHMNRASAIARAVLEVGQLHTSTPEMYRHLQDEYQDRSEEGTPEARNRFLEYAAGLDPKMLVSNNDQKAIDWIYRLIGRALQQAETPEAFYDRYQKIFFDVEGQTTAVASNLRRVIQGDVEQTDFYYRGARGQRKAAVVGSSDMMRSLENFKQKLEAAGSSTDWFTLDYLEDNQGNRVDTSKASAKDRYFAMRELFYRGTYNREVQDGFYYQLAGPFGAKDMFLFVRVERLDSDLAVSEYRQEWEKQPQKAKDQFLVHPDVLQEMIEQNPGDGQFLANFALNKLVLDQELFGSYERYKNLPDLWKRGGSTSSDGMALPVHGGEEGLPEQTNTIVLHDPKIEGKGELFDGQAIFTREYGRRAAEASGEYFARGDLWFGQMKAIYSGREGDNQRVLIKTNWTELETFAKKFPKSRYARILKAVERYNEGKDFKDQIHAITFHNGAKLRNEKRDLDLDKILDRRQEITPALMTPLNTSQIVIQQDLRRSTAPRLHSFPRQAEAVAINLQNGELEQKLLRQLYDFQMQTVGEIQSLKKVVEAAGKSKHFQDLVEALATMDPENPMIADRVAFLQSILIDEKIRPELPTVQNIEVSTGDLPLRGYRHRVKTASGRWTDYDPKVHTAPQKLALPQVNASIRGARTAERGFKSFEAALEVIGRDPEAYRDLHDRHGKIMEWELIEEDGTWTIPGSLIIVTRIPADDLRSVTLARVNEIISESENFIQVPDDVNLASGADKDGDARMINLMSEGHEKNDLAINQFILSMVEDYTNPENWDRIRQGIHKERFDFDGVLDRLKEEDAAHRDIRSNTPQGMERSHEAMLQAKRMVGIVAKTNGSYRHMQLMGIRVNVQEKAGQRFVRYWGATGIQDDPSGEIGLAIGDVLNITVDNEKDPILHLFNLSYDTINMALTLLMMKPVTPKAGQNMHDALTDRLREILVGTMRKPIFQDYAELAAEFRGISEGEALAGVWTDLQQRYRKYEVDKLRTLKAVGSELYEIGQYIDLKYSTPSTAGEFLKLRQIEQKIRENGFQYLDVSGMMPEGKPHYSIATAELTFRELEKTFKKSLTMTKLGQKIVDEAQAKQFDVDLQRVADEINTQFMMGVTFSRIPAEYGNVQSLLPALVKQRNELLATDEFKANRFLTYVQENVDRGGEKQLQLLDLYRFGPMHEQEENEAQADFDKLPQDFQDMLAAYVFGRYGAQPRAMRGSYLQLIGNQYKTQLNEAVMRERKEWDSGQMQQEKQDAIIENVLLAAGVLSEQQEATPEEGEAGVGDVSEEEWNAAFDMSESFSLLEVDQGLVTDSMRAAQDLVRRLEERKKIPPMPDEWTNSFGTEYTKLDDGTWMSSNVHGLVHKFTEDHALAEWKKLNTTVDLTFEEVAEIVEEWKEANNIVYDPQEAYSRSEGFFHDIGAFNPTAQALWKRIGRALLEQSKALRRGDLKYWKNTENQVVVSAYTNRVTDEWVVHGAPHGGNAWGTNQTTVEARFATEQEAREYAETQDRLNPLPQSDMDREDGLQRPLRRIQKQPAGARPGSGPRVVIRPSFADIVWAAAHDVYSGTVAPEQDIMQPLENKEYDRYPDMASARSAILSEFPEAKRRPSKIGLKYPTEIYDVAPDIVITAQQQAFGSSISVRYQRRIPERLRVDPKAPSARNVSQLANSIAAAIEGRQADHYNELGIRLRLGNFYIEDPLDTRRFRVEQYSDGKWAVVEYVGNEENGPIAGPFDTELEASIEFAKISGAPETVRTIQGIPRELQRLNKNLKRAFIRVHGSLDAVAPYEQREIRRASGVRESFSLQTAIEQAEQQRLTGVIRNASDRRITAQRNAEAAVRNMDPDMYEALREQYAGNARVLAELEAYVEPMLRTVRWQTMTRDAGLSHSLQEIDHFLEYTAPYFYTATDQLHRVFLEANRKMRSKLVSANSHAERIRRMAGYDDLHPYRKESADGIFRVYTAAGELDSEHEKKADADARIAELDKDAKEGKSFLERRRERKERRRRANELLQVLGAEIESYRRVEVNGEKLMVRRTQAADPQKVHHADGEWSGRVLVDVKKKQDGSREYVYLKDQDGNDIMVDDYLAKWNEAHPDTPWQQIKSELMEYTEETRQQENEFVRAVNDGKDWIKSFTNYIKHKYRSDTAQDREAIKQLVSDLQKRAEQSSAALQRTFSSYEEAAFSKGLRPITMNVADLIEIRAKGVWQAAVNKVMLSHAVLARDVSGQPMVLLSLASKEDKPSWAPNAEQDIAIPDTLIRKAARQLADWMNLQRARRGEALVVFDKNRNAVEMYNELVNEYMETEGKQLYKTLDSPFRSINDVKVLDDSSSGRDTVRLMRQIVDIPWGQHYDKETGLYRKNMLVGFVEGFNTWSKGIALSISLFHPVALMESFIALHGLRPLHKSPAMPWNWRGMVMDLRNTYRRFQADPTVLEKWTDHGLRADFRNPEVDLTMIHRHLRLMAEQIEGSDGAPAAYLADGIRGFSKGWKFLFQDWLWTRLHPAIKVLSAERMYEHLRMQAIEDDAPFDEKRVREAISQTINDALGGQEWERYIWATPKARQVLHWLMFAPDWSLSALNISGVPNAPFLNAFMKGNQTEIQKRWELEKYWPAMVILVMGVLPNVLQSLIWLATRPFGGDPDDKPFMWQNEEDKRGMIPGLGYVDLTPAARLIPGYKGDPTGKRRVYIRWAKQATEVYEGWLTRPAKTALGKSSPAFRTAFEQITGHNSALWELEFKEGAPMKGLFEGKYGHFGGSRVAYVGRKFLPMSILTMLDGRPSSVLAPMSRGISKTGAQLELARVLIAYGDRDVWKRIEHNERRKQNLREIGAGILEAARRNGYDEEEILNRAKAHALGRFYGEWFRALNKGQYEKLERISEGIIRLNGTLDGIERSMKKRFGMYGRQYTPEMHAHAKLYLSE